MNLHNFPTNIPARKESVMIEERRKYPRKPLMFFARVYERDSEDLLGHLGDLTPEGAMIISDHPIATGENLKLSLEIPEHLLGRNRLNLEVNSVWCKPDLDPHYYNTGFKLLNIREDDTPIINWIIENYCVEEKHQTKL
jgi:hypothetical protein